jgi:hypothetical protein
MRKVFFSLLLLALVHTCIAQEETKQKRNFKGGLIAGAVTTQISGDGLGGWDKFGLAAGAWVNVPFSDRSSATMTMKYINKGSRTKRDTINFETSGYYLNYIEIPLWFSYRLSKKSDSRLVLNAGPCIGFLLNQKKIQNGINRELTPPFRKLDVGLELGLAYEITPSFSIHLAGSSSVLQTRPNPGQTNWDSYYERGNYNQTLQLLLSIAF